VDARKRPEASAVELPRTPDLPRRWYWRDELEAIQRSAGRVGYPPTHPAAPFTHTTSQAMRGLSTTTR